MISRRFGDRSGGNNVDIKDVVVVAWGCGEVHGRSRWNSVLDLNGDDKIDMKHVIIVTKDFRQKGMIYPTFFFEYYL